MSNKNLLPEKDRELAELVERYETARAENKALYMDAEDLADLAEWYSRRNRFDDAAEVINYGLEMHPGNTSLLVEQAYLHLDQFDLDSAQQTARLITEERTDVTILRARLLTEEGRLEDAELVLDTLEEKYSKENIIDVAYMYLETGQRQQALEWLSHWHWDTDHQEYCAIMADSLLNEQNYREALTFYDKLIDSNPYQPQYWMGAARCQLGMGAYDKTIDACDYALLADEDLGEAHLLKGYSFLELNNPQKAMESYEEAIRCKAITKAYVYLLWGQYFVEAREWDKAYSSLLKSEKEEEALKDPISRSSLYSSLALCLKHQDKEGNKERIMSYCLKAIDLDYYNLSAQLLGGLIFIEEGKKETGLSMWEEIGELIPEPATWMDIFRYATEAMLFDEAIEALKKVEKADPAYPGLYKKLTLSCILAGRNEEASHYNRISPSPIKQEHIDTLYDYLREASREELKQLLDELQK